MSTNAVSGAVQGHRIYVGAKTPTENLPRNTVLLKNKTTPPLSGSNVWLRSFDVDDTTDEKLVDNDRVVDTNGHAGGDNFYQFLPPTATVDYLLLTIRRVLPPRWTAMARP